MSVRYESTLIQNDAAFSTLHSPCCSRIYGSASAESVADGQVSGLQRLYGCPERASASRLTACSHSQIQAGQ
eukprot:scaffold1564_cov389-Prasinococcus_capsulatus_cf.AAC.20